VHFYSWNHAFFRQAGKKNFALFSPAMGMMLDMTRMPMLELPEYIHI